MTLATWAVNNTIKGLTHLICRVNAEPLSQIPQQGPLILVGNHINFLEVPVIYTHLQPRPVTGFVKAETWENPAMAILFNFWGGIPLRRGEADLEAYRLALEALAAGRIVAVAPEGTRSGNGCLQRGHPGIVPLALHSGAPLMPMAYFGGELLRSNLKRLRRTDFHVRVGRQFILELGDARVTRQVRQAITDEIMYQLAGLLPPAYRGAYADPGAASTKYLRFL